MFFSVFLVWLDCVHYCRHIFAYLLFIIPGYLQWHSRHAQMRASYVPICLESIDPKVTQELLADIYVFHGEKLQISHRLWDPVAASHIWREQMHSFAWLTHLALSSDPNAHERMRYLIADWTKHNKQWSLPAWRSDITGTRLYYLLAHYRKITHKMSDKNIKRFHSLLYQHYRHLKQVAHWEMRGSCRLTAEITLVIAMLCRSEQDNILKYHLIRLVENLNKQIFADGGHVERNAKTHSKILQWLCILYDLFIRDQRSLPEKISATIDRMVPFLRMMRRADGGFYMFNGSGAGNKADIERLLEYAVPDGRLPRALKSAPHSGFELLNNQQIECLLDVGDMPDNPHSYRLHASSLGIEVMVMGYPVIVSCGSFNNHANPYWSHVQRGTMAHSTIVVGGYNASSLRRYASRRAKCISTRREEEGHILIRAQHNGYIRSSRTLVERNIYMQVSEAKITGEDSLIAGASYPFQIRFHLSHWVRVRVQGRDVFLEIDQSHLCQFFYEGADFTIEPSIYSPDHAVIYRNRQLVLSGKTLSKNTIIRWSFRYLGTVEEVTREYGDILESDK